MLKSLICKYNRRFILLEHFRTGSNHDYICKWELWEPVKIQSKTIHSIDDINIEHLTVWENELFRETFEGERNAFVNNCPQAEKEYIAVFI